MRLLIHQVLVIASCLNCFCHGIESTEEQIRIRSGLEGSCSENINSAIQDYSNTLQPSDTDTANRVLSATIASGVITGHQKISSDDYEICNGTSSFIDDIAGNLTVHLAELSDHVKNIPTSCEDIQDQIPSAASGYYTISIDGVLNEVYCYMDGSNCGGGVWTRIAHFDMSEPDAVCPNGLAAHKYSNLDHPVCARPANSFSGCVSIYFPSNGQPFSNVCGRIRGYQYNSPDAFYPNIGDQTSSIEGRYVDGYSITFGHPRNHIWSYAGGLEQKLTLYPNAIVMCPCVNRNDVPAPPSYVGSDYYCESGLPIGEHWYGGLYADDPLWDGENCIGEEPPCCTHPNMPWFSKNLGTTTTDDVEVRLCGTETSANEDTPFDILELYIH